MSVNLDKTTTAPITIGSKTFYCTIIDQSLVNNTCSNVEIILYVPTQHIEPSPIMSFKNFLAKNDYDIIKPRGRS